MKSRGLRKIKENKAIYRKDVPYDIRERSFQFALRVGNFVRNLPRDRTAQTLGQQLLRSATSVGANIEESDGSTTAKDRTYKRALSRKETRETRYWLRLIRASVLDNDEAQALQQESEELIRILSILITKNVTPPT
jgi:four helix bundle protein